MGGVPEGTPPQLPQQMPPRNSNFSPCQRGAEASTAAESGLPGDQHSEDPNGSHSHHPCPGAGSPRKHKPPLHSLKIKLHLQFLEGLTASLHAWMLYLSSCSYIFKFQLLSKCNYQHRLLRKTLITLFLHIPRTTTLQNNHTSDTQIQD